MKKLPISVLLVIFMLAFAFSFGCKKGTLSGPVPTPTIQDTALYSFAKRVAERTGNSCRGYCRGIKYTAHGAYPWERIHGAFVPAFTGQFRKCAVLDAPIYKRFRKPDSGKVIDTFPVTGGGGILITSGTGYVWQNSWTNFTKGAWNKRCLTNNPSYTAGGHGPGECKSRRGPDRWLQQLDMEGDDLS